MNLTSWLEFLRDTDCFDHDEASEYHFTPEHAQRVFVQCNVEIGADAALAKANQDDTFCRYEFVDATLRVVDVKYNLEKAPSRGGTREDKIVACVRRFKDEHLSKLPADAKEDNDDFRKKHLYWESVDKILWKHDKLLKQIWEAYAKEAMKAGRASFGVAQFLKFLQAAGVCDGSDARVAARRAFVMGRTMFVDNVDPRFQELTYVSFLEALCRFIFAETEIPSPEHLEEVGPKQLTEFYEKLYSESTAGDAINAINRLRRILAPDLTASLARKLDLVLPYVLQCFAVSCGGDFVTKLSTVRLTHVLTRPQQDRWLQKNVKITRENCEHVLALDEFKALAHATDKKNKLAEAVALAEVGGKGVW